MKILHIETGRHLYGGALQVFYLLRGLHAAGVENILVCAPGSDDRATSASDASAAGLSISVILSIITECRLKSTAGPLRQE